ncbi:MAG TPA: pentapeptide repeat-containing protein [Caulobacteraceae bacterium]|jgi:uncharacterized protein YjbI with pentapeptide repeats
MKPLTLIAAVAVATAAIVGSAQAQNAGEIERARAGANCPHCNLFQADFSSLQLKGRNLAGSRLRQADMSASVMNFTNLAGTDLRDVNAYGGVFTGTIFAGANMTNASFVGAYLQGANFRGATLTGVNFSGAEMDRAVGLTEAQLSGACGDATTLLPRGLHLRACH